MLRTYWFDAVDPLRELTSLHQWMDQTLEHVLNNHTAPAVASRTFAPPAEVFEDAEKVALKIDVPGLSEKDFDITLNNGLLTVRGERKLENGFKQENLTWTERPYGVFVRSFNLPNTIDVNSINATCTNGVLEIVFAKREEAKPKQIPVKVAQKELTVSSSA
jgi:HSP20 family protein